jgi:fibrinogen beta/gamma subunit family protein
MGSGSVSTKTGHGEDGTVRGFQGRDAMCALLSTFACIVLTGCALVANLGEFNDAVAAVPDADSVVDASSGSSETGAPGDPTLKDGYPGQADADSIVDALSGSSETGAPGDPGDGYPGQADAEHLGPTDAGSSPNDGPSVDSGPLETSYASCLEILDAAPASASATYVISQAGMSLDVYCDMSFAGGGWTLVQSTNGGSCTPATETAGTVALGSCAYMPNAALTALAQGSTTVQVRSASGAATPTAYITSATALPMQNLRMGLITNANETVGDPVSEEAAWTVVGDPGMTASQGRTPQSILTFTCSVAGEMWPAVYRACGNGADGFVLDVVDNVSFWNWGITPRVNVPMEVYVR